MGSKIKIAFDLDGIFVDKPPLVPKKVIEYLFKGRCKDVGQLYYRFPKNTIEQKIRILSHFYLLRPVIKKNTNLLLYFKKNGGGRLYLISSRYSFLKKATFIWLKKRGILNCFEKIILNTNDLQPHLFKEKYLNKIKPSFYFEDDYSTSSYLQKKCPGVKVIFVAKKRLLLPL